MRILTAVDRPELRERLGHHCNVLVFPQRGLRPHQHETSGGDLDGDEFVVIWNPSLVPRHDHAPMEYDEAAEARAGCRPARGANGSEAPRRPPPGPTAATLTDYIQSGERRSLGLPPPPKPEAGAGHRVADLIEFFIEYIQEEALGQISNAWLKTADYSRHMAAADADDEYRPPSRPDERGIFDPQCLQLAGLASKAVDYQKNGTAVTLPPPLRATKVPHFMDNGKPGQDLYHSRTELGRLYDLAKPAEQGLGRGGGGGGGAGAAVAIYDGRLFMPGCATHLAEAASAMAAYRAELAQVMAQYGVTDEAALLSGQLTRFDAAQHAGSRAHDVAERCGHAAGAAAHELRVRYQHALAIPLPLPLPRLPLPLPLPLSLPLPLPLLLALAPLYT